MKKLAVFFIVAFASLLASCEFPLNYASTPLAGVGSTADGWAMVSGTIDADGDVEIVGNLAGRNLLFTVSPLAVGEVRLQMNLFDLANMKTVTFYDGSTNYIMSEGGYEILSITDTTVSGRMYVYNDTHTFNGTFDLTRVP
jgi:hypothetical protein